MATKLENSSDESLGLSGTFATEACEEVKVSNTELESVKLGHPKNRAQNDFGNPIKLLIGSDAIEVIAPKMVLCDNSAFCATALNGNWKASSEGQLVLSDAKVPSCLAYLHWAFTGKFSLPSNAQKQSSNFGPLFRLYVLADTFGVTGLRNDTLNELRKIYRQRQHLPAAQHVTYAYDNTAPGSKLREWLCDIFVHNGTSESFTEDMGDQCGAFTVDVLQRKFKKDTTGFDTRIAPILRIDQCFYHEHDEAWPACGKLPTHKRMDEEGL